MKNMEKVRFQCSEPAKTDIEQKELLNFNARFDWLSTGQMFEENRAPCRFATILGIKLF
jgi:hypothetical protein